MKHTQTEIYQVDTNTTMKAYFTYLHQGHDYVEYVYLTGPDNNAIAACSSTLEEFEKLIAKHNWPKIDGYNTQAWIERNAWF